MNEPIVFCGGYPLPPPFHASAIPAKQQPYFCGQNVLLAHSQVYHLGKSMGIQGTISFKTNGGYKIPLTDSSDDAIAVQRAWDFAEGWFASPIFLGGRYPPYLQQYTSTFLRDLTAEEMTRINGSSDIFAYDAYTSQFYMAPDKGFDACLADPSDPLFPSCVNTTYNYVSSEGGWDIGYAADPRTPWLHKATDWVPAMLHYVQDTWQPQAIAITEFGFTALFEDLKPLVGDIRLDLARSAYYHDYLEGILTAMSEGVHVVGTLAWSILDNLECKTAA